ncbi:unnamed protein product [Urochloa humidicola]
MASVRSPPPPPPGAHLPTSLTPAPIPGPTATLKGASACSPSPAPGTCTSPPSSPSPSAIASIVGRSKAQRWCCESPPSGKSGGGAPTFMEVLLSCAQPATTTASGTASQAPGVNQAASIVAGEGIPAVPHIVLREEGRGHVKTARRPLPDGLLQVQSRRERKERQRLELRPRRTIPVDLRGKCFNCFSEDHRAMNCKSKPHCFHCRGVGHRIANCRGFSTDLRHATSRPMQLVWRPKPTQAGREVPPAASSERSMELVGAQGRKKRHRTRRKRNGAGPNRLKDYSGKEEDDDDNTDPVGFIGEESEVPLQRPKKILDRSTSISQREDDLARALVVFVLSGSGDHILPSLTSRFEIEASSMTLQRFGKGRFLLILPNVKLVERVLNGSCPFTSMSPPLRLHVQRWTRLIDAKAGSLTTPIEVDLQGIPAHAWELATAELLLSDHCWIDGVHPDSARHFQAEDLECTSSSDPSGA